MNFSSKQETMVYCGKPSRGCQMCRTRRIKVSSWVPRAMNMSNGTTSFPYSSIADRTPHPSAMKPNQHVCNARSLDDNVQDIKTTSTLSSAMKLKQQKGEQGEQAITRRSTRKSHSQRRIQPSLPSKAMERSTYRVSALRLNQTQT